MKFKRFKLPEESFIQLFKTGEVRAKCISGFPADARFVRWYQDNYANIQIVVTSDEFEDIEEGGIIPEFQPLFEKLN